MVRVLSWNITLGGTWWLFPVMAVLSCTGVGLILEQSALVKGFYASPYVMVVAWSALRSGRRGGLLAAAMSAALWNYTFVQPHGFTWPSNEELLAYLSMVGAAWVVGGYKPLPDANKTTRYGGVLPFVRGRKRDGDANHYWDVTPSGNWSYDTHLGQEYARIYLERCRGYGAPTLGWIVRDMIRAGAYSGIEAGFLGGVCSHVQRQRVALRSDHHADQLHLN